MNVFLPKMKVMLKFFLKKCRRLSISSEKTAFFKNHIGFVSIIRYNA